LQARNCPTTNINDTDAAYECIGGSTPSATAAASSSSTPSLGVAEGTDLVDAYRKALACDSTSAYGGIIALNRRSTPKPHAHHRHLHRG